jgi:Flp pilus assembly protein TadD
VFFRAIRICGLGCALLLSIGCERRPAPGIQRLAILRFENLTPDPATDWMGRGFSEVITAELAGATDVYAIPSARLHLLNQTMGARPIAAPGISAEAPLAIAAGANRIAYGDYSISGGRLRCTLTVEDLQTRDVVEGPIEISSGASEIITAATTLARKLSAQARPYSARYPAALEAYAKAVEASDGSEIVRFAEQAIAADPNYGAAYTILAEMKAKQQDRAGAMAALAAAQARGDGIAQTDRIRLEILAATLQGDRAARERAMTALVEASPLDPAAWRMYAEAAVTRQRYSEAAQAYQRALAVEPEDWAMWNQLGYTAAYAGSTDVALKALQRYQALRPSDPNSLDSMGDVNLLAGRLQEAERLYLDAYRRQSAATGGAELYKAAMARLMTGDVAGADSIAKQGSGELASSAEWLWVSGRRKEAYTKLAAQAPGLSNRDLQARAYAHLAVWALLLNDRRAAAEMAQKAASMGAQLMAGTVAAVRFVTLPPATPAEWAARAAQSFPNAAPNSLKDYALAYALLVNGHFEAAVPVLKQLEAHSPANGDRSEAIELAWALIETGDIKNAAPLLRMNPVPNTGGGAAFFGLPFPRLFRLRAIVAERAGKADEARENQRIYKALGGE